MKICILGFGNVGARLAHLWSRSGHTISIGLRTGSSHVATARQQNLRVQEPQPAAQGAEVVVLALPWEAVETVLGSAGSLDGKILLDATNPLNSDLRTFVPPMGSGGQQVAAWCPGATVVKAFNTIGAAYFGNPAFDMLYCTDKPEAAELCHGLIQQTQMRPVHVGPLMNAAYLEHLAGLWIHLAMNGTVQGPFGFNLMSEQGR